MRKNLDQEPEGGASAAGMPGIDQIAGEALVARHSLSLLDTGAAPKSRTRAAGHVLSCAGYDDSIRWRPGERLEQLFEERCDELARQGCGAATAVDGPNGALTYAELDARANQLARHLASRQVVRPGDRVALLFDRAVDGYVAMLAVLKLRAAYVPLDPSFPAERVAYIASDAGASVVLTRSQLASNLDEVVGDTRVLFLDQVEVEVAGERDQRLSTEEVGEALNDLCYVVYTSGTTGRPKGVAISHQSIVNFVRVAAEVYGLRRDDRVYQGLTIAFDFSIEEIWVAWMAGATLVPKPSGQALLGPELHDFLTEHRVTALCCVPTLLATLEQELPALRFLLVSGESCPQDLVERWHRPGRRFLNVYGPTEATVSATWTVLDPSRPVTIGVPLPTYSAVVLHPEHDLALPPGSLGELAVAGVGLADGYLGRPELTERAFIADFLAMPANPSRRIYRTGDLVRVTEHGEIEHHGRIDTQVKIRGYRIEVGEIEAVLRQVPGVAHAVVDGYEPEAGVKELVAYYTSSAEIDSARIYAALRERLPEYMVPAYLERLDEVPTMTSGKVDRKALPTPRGTRRVSDEENYLAPASDTESTLAQTLADVLGLERVSVLSNFFDQLGANSLLMARFTARLRATAPELPPVSMKDIYLNPSVRGLATALLAHDGQSDAASEPRWREPELPEPVGKPHYFLCGALQLLTLLGYVSVAAFGLDATSSWVFKGHGVLEIYLRALATGAGLLVGMGLVPVAVKWILIGRFKPQRIRAWSLAYVRFWIVKTLLVSNPLPRLLHHTPLYPLYLRALGAKVSRHALILGHHVPVCTDLLSIGPDSVIRAAFFNGYRARAGAIEIGPVTIGSNALVGEGSVLDIYTELGDDAQLGHSSSLHAGQVVPAGECWHGSPARSAPGDYDYRVPVSNDRKRLTAVMCSVRRLGALIAIGGPLEALSAAAFFTHPAWLSGLSVFAIPALSAGILLGGYVGALIIALTVPRLLSRLLAPGKAYPVYGLHFGLLQVVYRTSNIKSLNELFGDSCAIVHYLRALGYKFGVIEQTGSNFGLDVKQDLPTRSHIGTGTMVSDGLAIMNAEFSSTSFRVRDVQIGKRNYIGNTINFPAEARTGENCLFGTKTMVPIAGPERSDVGLLGSPCIEIPRSVARDERFASISTGEERKRRLKAKTHHNVGTMAIHVGVLYAMLLGFLWIAAAPLGGNGILQLLGTTSAPVLEIAFVVALSVLVERVITALRPLEPRYCSIYQIEFWRHERYWKVAPTGYVHLFDGTPFKSLLWRALGVPIGRRVFDNGLSMTERTLVSIGDECTFNPGSELQSHTLEDGVFKSDHIAVGGRCTIGTGALVNYDVTMEDGSVVEADSFVMKGSRLQAGARWRGNPATEVAEPVAPSVVSLSAAASLGDPSPVREQALEAA